MKVFVILLLGVIFLALISSSVQSISADHESGNGIFKDENNVNLASTIDSKWLIHLHVVVLDAQGQLVSVTEGLHGSYIPHEITDYTFDKWTSQIYENAQIKIITIDNVEYEKVQFVQTITYCETLTDNLEDRWCRPGMQSHWTIDTCMKTK